MSDIQIFISYSRDDDLPPPPNSPGSKGFVSYLHDQLEREFKDLGPLRPKFWRDIGQVPDGAQFKPIIDAEVAKSSFLLVILSPNWMSREFCRYELDSFAERWKREGPEGIKRRIVVVNKRHIVPGKRPPLLQGQVGYSFHALDDPNNLEHQYFWQGRVTDDRYYGCLRRLVGYLWQQTDNERAQVDPQGTRLPPPPSAGQQTAPESPGRTIFVAKPATDMRQAYDRVVKELSGRNYSVVPAPETEVPQDASATAMIEDSIKLADISIHLLGEKMGPSPEDADPIVKLQLARAAAAVPALIDDDAAQQRPAFRRVIWAPEVLDDNGGRVSSTIERSPLLVLRKFDQHLPTDKVIGGSLSSFVDFLLDHIERTTPLPPAPARPQKPPGDEPTPSTRLYLFHAPEDTEYAFDLAESLEKRQVEAVVPAMDGSEEERKSFHLSQLRECDAVALCWAQASEVWVRAQSGELKDWQKLGRKEQFAYRGVVAGPPPGTRKGKKGMRRLFPPSEIDRIIDLTETGQPPQPELLDDLVPGAPPIQA